MDGIEERWQDAADLNRGGRSIEVSRGRWNGEVKRWKVSKRRNGEVIKGGGKEGGTED